MDGCLRMSPAPWSVASTKPRSISTKGDFTTIKPPCKVDGVDCPNRRIGCQRTCEGYLAFRKERDEYLEYRKKTRIGALYASDTAYAHRKSWKHPTASQRRLFSQR